MSIGLIRSGVIDVILAWNLISWPVIVLYNQIGASVYLNPLLVRSCSDFG